MISSPASNGSSLSTITRFASPPPNRCVNSCAKLVFTCSNAVNRRSRPSRFKLAIPLRSVLIASSRSAFSPTKLSCSTCTSSASSSARKFTAPNASRWRFNAFTLASNASEAGISSGFTSNAVSNWFGVFCCSSAIRSAAAVTVSRAASERASARARASRASDAKRSQSRSFIAASRNAPSPTDSASVAAALRTSASEIARLSSSRLAASSAGAALATFSSASEVSLRSTNSALRLSAVSKR